MWTRTFAGAACALLAASGVPADSITIEGQPLQDVLVTETGALYYVMFPETGRSAGYAKDKVDPASVVIEPDAEKRRVLRERYEATRPPMPEPPAAEGPKLIRDPAEAAEDGAPENEAAEAMSPVDFEAAAPEDFAAPQPAAPVTPGGWRQPKLRVGRPGAPAAAPFSQPGAVPPAATPPAPAGEPAPDPFAVQWTHEPAAAETPAEALPDPTEDPAALPEDPAMAATVPEPAVPDDEPVVIDQQAYLDEKGVKSLVIKGNRQRDPYRDARILQKIRAEDAAQAAIVARQQAEWAAAEAAAEQAAYEQWLQEQAYWDAYAAEQMATPPQIVEDQWGLSIQGGGEDPYAALLQMEGYDTY